ncbi:ribose-phosphate pyrophosphokinase-like domain-containing protein [Terrimonas pollutisoli]|uniref:ribose-phosphate pyrophosphokinase-like domain-containing protein n=1 Tax=Terrimonas pollutisoli TaxID=3034147 RepID=UPI0023EADB22|nr:ribose-phosphate pyrophosphokinase-like domain-containing protein [Terrimonas sp. H1YJ31]
MKIINLNTGEGIQFTLFPDNQPHINIHGIGAGEEVKVICSITDSLRMMHLLQTANALDNLHAKKTTLVIPYLMAARYDRLMLPGDSFDLEVVAGLINSCGFEKVWLWDVHSEVAIRLIRNAANIKNRKMVEQYKLQDAVLICPDAGAAKKTDEYFTWNSNLTEIVYCKKSRDLATGKISLELQEPGKCFNRNCVIIDDICDGGATFLAIASQIKPAHLTLIVTHGIFSKGFAALTDQFDEIITSDSFCRIYNGEKVKTISIDYDHL